MASEYNQPQYMSATIAKRKTESARSLDGAYMRAETESVLKTIALAAESGAGSTRHPTHLDPVTVKRLEHLGYTVVWHNADQRDMRDSGYTEIKWM